MNHIEKPMLAVNADLEKIQYPVLVSPKLDGIRCLVIKGNAVSRQFKPIPNVHIRKIVESMCEDGMDGELLLPQCTEEFRKVSSAVMKRTGEPDFRFGIFDWLHPEHGAEEGFKDRFKRLYNWMAMKNKEWKEAGNTDPFPLFVVNHARVEAPDETLQAHQEASDAGFEGIMVRSLDGKYKFGRSTVRQGLLLKVKNFVDEEATITGFAEQMHNENELEVDELGHAKRSSKKSGKVGKNTLGALLLIFDDDTEFQCGTGFDDEQRQAIWDNSDAFIGKTVKIKHQPDPGGRKEGQAPRFPVYLGLRNTEID